MFSINSLVAYEILFFFLILVEYIFLSLAQPQFQKGWDIV